MLTSCLPARAMFSHTRSLAQTHTKVRISYVKRKKHNIHIITALQCNFETANIYIYIFTKQNASISVVQNARGGIFSFFFLYIVLFRHHVSACVPTHMTPKVDRHQNNVVPTHNVIPPW
uniref:Uncharacterized protein n=1 Tax=Schizaphis graminum TaxID=13262 RepID=A0A2S2P7H5_SCHGA